LPKFVKFQHYRTQGSMDVPPFLKTFLEVLIVHVSFWTPLKNFTGTVLNFGLSRFSRFEIETCPVFLSKVDGHYLQKIQKKWIFLIFLIFLSVKFHRKSFQFSTKIKTKFPLIYRHFQQIFFMNQNKSSL